jgi:fructose-bisphosphate aldolase, class I
MVTTMDKPTVKQAVARVTLDEMTHLNTGKRARLARLLYNHGPKNGTLIFLPIDQGLEHGPVDFFENPASADPNFQCQLALNAGYSAIVFHYGIAHKYMHPYAGLLPLVLKINGKTCVPPDAHSFSTLTGRVEDAVRLGADAIGYTLYVGSSGQDRDIEQFTAVRNEAEKLGIPVIVWAYPRGEYIEKKGGKDSLYAIDYAARVATELGADVVKINIPNVNNPKKSEEPGEYKDLKLSTAEGIQKVVRSAGKTLVVFSGGSKVSNDELVNMAKSVMDNGATGLIFGRNMWQRPMDEAVQISQGIIAMMKQY